MPFLRIISLLFLVTFIVQNSLGADRARVRIANNTVVAENGFLLRGENPRWNWNHRNDPAWWEKLRDDYHLNTVRILCYRPPQNYPGGCGSDCNLPSAQQMLPALDQWVDRASEEGFYVIIDYHPVGGRDEADATAWWSVVAPRYANRTHVLYEITNEPGGAGIGLAGYMRRMRERIRAEAPDTHLIYWSVENARDNNINAMIQHTDSIGADWDKATIAHHMYWDYNFPKIEELHELYPTMNSEIGSGEGWRPPTTTVTTDCENLGISWIWLDAATFDRVPPSFVFWPADPNAIPDGTSQPRPPLPPTGLRTR